MPHAWIIVIKIINDIDAKNCQNRREFIMLIVLMNVVKYKIHMGYIQIVSEAIDKYEYERRKSP